MSESEGPTVNQNPTTKKAGDFVAGDITKSRGRPTKIKEVWREEEKVFMKMQLMETPFSKVSLDGVHETFVMPYLGKVGEQNETAGNAPSGDGTDESNAGQEAQSGTESSGSEPETGKAETEKVQENSEPETAGTEEGTQEKESETETSAEKESPEEGKTELKSTLSAAVRNKKRGR